MARMIGSADELQLLQNLCRTIGAKKCLDIGMSQRELVFAKYMRSVTAKFPWN